MNPGYLLVSKAIILSQLSNCIGVKKKNNIKNQEIMGDSYETRVTIINVGGIVNDVVYIFLLLSFFLVMTL